MNQFDGVITALATPFYQGEVDFRSLKKLVRYQLDAGVEGFVLNGTTGESPTLKWDEVKTIFEFVSAEVSGEVPLIVGSGTNDTETSRQKTRDAEKWGADGALVVNPYYNKPPQRGLVGHFKSIAKSTSLPLILYNVPGRTIVSLDLASLKDLAAIENIVGVKEASGNVLFGRSVVESCENFTVTSGDDPTCLDLCLNGGHGVISVISHVLPGKMVEWVKRCRNGDATALEEYRERKSLLDAVYGEVNPIGVKKSLHLMGLIDSAEMRLPLVELDADLAQHLKESLENWGCIH